MKIQAQVSKNKTFSEKTMLIIRVSQIPTEDNFISKTVKENLETLAFLIRKMFI
jgi:hypothetical protein